MLVVLFGVAWLIGATNVLHVSIEGVAAVALMLLGASLVVTGRTDWSLSRRSWPVWLGLGLIVVLVATSSSFGARGALNNLSFGDKQVTASVGQTIHGGFGKLTVTLPSTTKTGTVSIVSPAGQIVVNPPPSSVDANYTVLVHARVVGGQICVNGKNAANGFQAQTPTQAQPTFQVGTPGANSPVLTLDVHEVGGQILINGQDCN